MQKDSAQAKISLKVGRATLLPHPHMYRLWLTDREQVASRLSTGQNIGPIHIFTVAQKICLKTSC